MKMEKTIRMRASKNFCLICSKKSLNCRNLEEGEIESEDEENEDEENEDEENEDDEIQID